MVYNINLNEKDYEKYIEKILEKYKFYKIIVDNQFLSIINKDSNILKNFNLVNIDNVLKLSINHLFNSGKYLQERVKYFSMSDLIKYCINRVDIDGSYASEIKKIMQFPSLSINNYIKCDISIELSGKKEKITDGNIKNLTPFLTFDEVVGLLQRSCNNIFNIILGSKILSSSFFFSELIDLFGYKGEYPILYNKFFKNFNEWKDFAKAINYSDFSSTLDEQNSFEEAFNYLKIKFNIESFENIPDFVIRKDNIFCNNAIIYDNSNNDINSNTYFVENINIKYSNPEERVLVLDGEKSEMFQSPYDFYMQYILKLKKKSINSLISKNIYGAILNNEKINDSLIFNSYSIIHFINHIKEVVEISNDKIIYKKCPTFIAFNNYDINRIKTYARSQLFNKIYIANFKTFLIDEFALKKSRLKNKVIIKY